MVGDLLRVLSRAMLQLVGCVCLVVDTNQSGNERSILPNIAQPAILIFASEWHRISAEGQRSADPFALSYSLGGLK